MLFLSVCGDCVNHIMAKPVYAISAATWENRIFAYTKTKTQNDQLHSNPDQRPCYCHTNSTFPLLPKSEISDLYPSSVIAQPGLCGTWSETPIFYQPGSYANKIGTDHHAVSSGSLLLIVWIVWAAALENLPYKYANKRCWSAVQLISNQLLCFRYIDSKIPPYYKPLATSVAVQPILCQTWSKKTNKQDFSWQG